MLKLFSLVVVMLAFFIATQGLPVASTTQNDEILEAVRAGDWKKVENLVIRGLDADHWTGLTLTGVKELKPPKGGHVYGESEYTFHAATDINGQKTEQSGGHKVINNDGKVNEYDFNPAEDVDSFFAKLTT